MLIPLGTDRPLARGTVVTWALIALTVAAYLVQVGGQQIDPDGWAPIQAKLMIWKGHFRWWTLFTHAFLHGSWWHLAGNMAFLWVFGPNIEDRFRRVGFLVFYLLGAAAAAGLHVAFDPHPALGASGAIAACTGAYLIMFPRAMIKVFALIFVIGIAHVPAWWLIGLSIVWDLVSQSGVGGAGGTGVAHLAHLGGYAFGMSVSFALLWMKVLPREPYDVFSSARQMYRRQQLKQAATQQDRATSKRWEKVTAPPPNNKRAAEDAARTAAIANARAEIARLVSVNDLDAAGDAYKRFAEQHADIPGATVLSRRYMYQLANHFAAGGDHRAAVFAYERFLDGYPTDPEAPVVRLMLGRLNARYLNDPVRAKALLKEALPGLRGEDEKEMARKELEALG